MNNYSRKPTILVVDDVPGNVDVFYEILSPYYNVQSASSGASALTIAGSKNPPDLILLDIMMPEMDGYEVCRRLKSDSKTKEIPVIFVSAKSEEEDETMGFYAGAVDYITKPVSLPLVLARISTHLRLRFVNTELKKQNDILQENLYLREQVDYIACHDMKTPLWVVLNTPHVFENDVNMTSEQKEMMQLLKEAGRMLLDMINNTQNLYKMETGEYKLSPEPVDILKTVRQITGELGDHIRGKKIALDIQKNGGFVRETDEFIVTGEELLYYSMLSNLIRNAVEASPMEEPIQISFYDGESRTVCIHNKGAVPVSIRSRFFEKYVTSGKEKGTGLGTYSAKLMADTMGCNISLETSEESGTTLSVHMPEKLFANP